MRRTRDARSVRRGTVDAGGMSGGGPKPAGAGAGGGGGGPAVRTCAVSRDASASTDATAKATGPGSQSSKSVSGRPAASSHSAASSAASGRSAGSAASAVSRTRRTGSGQPARWGGRVSVPAMAAATTRPSPSPYGWRPVAATAASSPRENTSLGGPGSRPRACSGDMKRRVPTRPPVAVRLVESAERAMPKSISQGPSAPMSTLPGLTSRCTYPAVCTACSARATHPVIWSTAATGRGPYASSTDPRSGPG